MKVLDMGLARLAETTPGDAEAVTREGTVMGTPDYIAPEQAVSSHSVDIRADLYSLGCTLYCLLAGRPPFAGGSLAEKLLKHQLEEPTPLEKLRPDVPPLVAAVVRKLMAKRPADRYQTPAELAQAQELLTRVTIPVARPAPASAAGPSVAAIPVMPQGTTVAWSPPPDIPVAKAVEETMPPGESESIPSLSRTAALSLPARKSLLLWEIERRQLVASFEAASSSVKSVVLSTDSRLALSGASGSSPNLRLWDLTKLLETEIFKTKTDQYINCVAIMPDGKQAVSGDVQRLIRFWYVTTGEPAKALTGHKDAVTSVACSPNGRYILSGGADATVRLWDLHEKEPRGLVLDDAPKAPISSVVYAPDGKAMAASGHDGRITLWDATTRKVLWQTHLPRAVYGLSFAQDSKHLATANANGTVYILRMN